MKKWILACLMFAAMPVMAQTTPNLGLTLPVQWALNWGPIINGDFTIIDTFAGNVTAYPGSAGIVYALTSTTSRVTTYADIVHTFAGGSCSGFLKNDGTCQVVTSGLTSFSSGNLNPLFTTSLGSSPTTSPALTFSLSNAAANSVFGNFTGSSATPTYSVTPVFSAAGLTNFPTLNQSTTGNAATASALAGTPTLCTVSGQFPTGILANGNATGCATPASSGGITSLGITTPSWLTVTGSPITTSGTIALTATTGLTANQFLATPDGTTGILAPRAIVSNDIPVLNQNTTGYAAGLAGGALGSAPYQSVANTTVFFASPTTSGHTFFYGWQPSGSAIAPVAIDAVGLFPFLSGSNTYTGTNTFNTFSVTANAGVLSSLYGTTSNCSSVASPAVCGSAAAGTVQVPASATTLTVQTTAINLASEIFYSYTVSGPSCSTVPANIASLLLPYTTNINHLSGTFQMTLPVTPTTNPACVSWHIVN